MADQCRIVETSDGPIRVRGERVMTPEDVAALEQVIAAAKRKVAAEDDADGGARLRRYAASMARPRRWRFHRTPPPGSDSQKTSATSSPRHRASSIPTNEEHENDHCP